MKTQVKKRRDFKPQPLKGIYANSEELGRDMNRFFMETLTELAYVRSRNKQEQ
jgi:hypothetical protein